MISPFSITKMRFAGRTVLNRCATMKTVRPLQICERFAWMMDSDS